MNIRKNMVGVAVLAAGQSGLVLADSEESFAAPTIVADMPASGTGFAHGGSVAAAADIVVVGRPFDGGSDSDGGAVDVFRRVATDATLEGVPWEWVFWCRLQPDVPMAGSRFGNSVAVDGMRVVVGCGPSKDSGRICIRWRPPNGFTSSVVAMVTSISTITPQIK